MRTSHYAAKNGLIKYLYEDVTTLYDNFQRGMKVSSKTTPTHLCKLSHSHSIVENGPCLGVRASPTGPYVWVSYGEVEERAKAFGAGLKEVGVESGQESFVGIYSQNGIEVRHLGGGGGGGALTEWHRGETSGGALSEWHRGETSGGALSEWHRGETSGQNFFRAGD